MGRKTLFTALLAVSFPVSAWADFTCTGVWEYEDKGWNYNGWNGNDPSKPIRYADVTVLNENNGQVLGTGSTQLDGSFSILCSSVGTTDVEVRVNSDTNLHSSQRIRVTNLSNQEYTAFSPVFSNHNTNNDLDIGTVTALKVTSGSDEANPFNMLDMAVASFNYVTGPLIGENNVSTVTVLWPNFSGSFASGFATWIDVDDGYDDAVILHEVGHIIHNAYSDSDSPGGTHFIGDSNQDPRLSLGEGFATFMAGVVMVEDLDRIPIYMDANGSSQNGGVQLRVRLETAEPFTTDAYGCADETAVACTLYDILDDELSNDGSVGSDDDLFISTTLVNGQTPHAAFWDVFTGPMFFAGNLTMNDAWEGWWSEHGATGNHAELDAVFRIQKCQFFPDPDEPNDTNTTPFPITPSSSWSGNKTLYKGDGDPPINGDEDRDWYEVFLVKGSQIDAETRYPFGASDADTQADTNVRLRSPSLVLYDDEDSGTGRNGAIRNFVVPETGYWLFRVRTFDNMRDYGRYNYRLQYDFENFLPAINSGPTATPATANKFEDVQLSVSATDAQALTYKWVALDGGSIVGSGATVTFDPPAVTEVTEFNIELTVEDSLGAQADPMIVTVTVDPNENLVEFPLRGTLK